MINYRTDAEQPEKSFLSMIQFNFHLTDKEYYEHKVRMILQYYYLTKIEEEGKRNFDNMLLRCRVWDT